MKKSKFREEHVAYALRLAESGMTVLTPGGKLSQFAFRNFYT